MSDSDAIDAKVTRLSRGGIPTADIQCDCEHRGMTVIIPGAKQELGETHSVRIMHREGQCVGLICGRSDEQRRRFKKWRRGEVKRKKRSETDSSSQRSDTNSKSWRSGNKNHLIDGHL